METKEFLVYTDGGARGNPGSAGIGIVIKRKAQSAKLKTVLEFSEYIGETTNNQAEYKAIIRALEEVKKIINTILSSKFHILCSMDSQLIVEQLNGRYKIKNEGLKPLYNQTQELITELEKMDIKINFQHITREQNQEADRLVNQAIDKHLLKRVNA